MNWNSLTSSMESAVYRIRRHSSQVGEGKKTALDLKSALESAGLRIREIKAKKALPEFKGHFAPEHWEVRVRFHALPDRIAGDKIAAPFMLETFKPASL
jgi:hypothetical protein